MKILPEQRVAKHGSQRSLFKLGPVATGCALLLLASGSVLAQQAVATTDLSTVTVTGIRKGIEDAISVKKNSDAIMESISAEDIGKLPDATIADSLARLPGVTTQRTKSGTASTISIRGLGPDFNGYLLNGREQTSTGDSRSVDMSVYPAELIAGANVYKTSDAGLMAAGLAGTIDTRLIDPLAFPGRVLAANVQKSRNSVGIDGVPEGAGNRQSLTYIDQFFDRTVGVAIGLVKVSGTTSSTSQSGWGDGNNATATLADGTVLTGVKIPQFGNGIEAKTITVDDKRTGVAAILAYKPNKDFTSQLDMFYAKSDSNNHQTWVAAGYMGGSNWCCANITNATVVNGVATKGTFQIGASPLNVIARSEAITDDDTNQSVGWKNTLKMGNGWTAAVDLSSNSAKRTERDIEAYASIPGATTLSFDTTGGSQRFAFGAAGAAAYIDPNQMKIRTQYNPGPDSWSGVKYPDGSQVPQAGYIKGPTIIDKVDAIRVDLKKELAEGSMFSEIQFGGNYTSRSKDRSTDEGLIISATNRGNDPMAYPTGSYVANNVGGTGLDVLTFSPTPALWPGAVILRKYNDDILSKTWGVKENITTGYAKLNIDTEYLKIPVRGNIGVQVVNTDQSSTGYRAQVGSSVTLTNPASGLVSDGKTYTDFLPSLNLTGDLGNGNVLRLGVAKEMARATLTDMRNSFAASVDGNTNNGTFGRFVGSGGNPNLDPYRATSVDLSYEKYFDKKAYFSAAAFYKKLDSYITTSTDVAYNYTNYASALGLAIPALGPVGIYTTTVNGNGGNLNGIELAGSAPFGLLAPVLNGFGASASFSSTNSSVSLPNLIGLNPTQQVPTGSMPLPGLSKTNWKLMLYYEQNGFSAFVANNARSTYVGSVANDGVGGYPTWRYIEGSNWISAQIGYEIQTGPAKGLAFRVEGNNLNKPVYRQLKADGSVDSEVKTGATIMFQLSYKY